MLPTRVFKRFSSSFQPLKDLIHKDHENIRKAFKHYQETKPTEEKKKWANECIRAIAVHSAAEEIAVYPEYGKRLDRGEEDWQFALDDHQKVKELLYKLDKEKVLSHQYDELLGQVMSLLDDHMKIEETDFLVRLGQVCSDKDILKITEHYEKLKKRVPTHPHPSTPTQPTLEKMVGAVQGVFDKIYDLMKRDFPEKK